MAVRWIADLQMEEMLKSYGVSFRVEKCNISNTLIKAGQRNNARLDVTAPVDETVATEYALAMEAGKPFPYLVMQRLREGLFPLSANHRLAAMELLGETEYTAYVVTGDVTPMVIDDIIRTANRMHGRRQSTEEALKHAAAQRAAYNISIAVAAQKFGITEQQLSRYEKSEKIATRLRLLAVSGVEKLNSSALLALGKMEKTQSVLREAAKIAVKYALNAGEIDAMAKKVGEAKDDERSKLEAIGRYDGSTGSKKAEAVGEKKQRPLRTQFVGGLHNLLKLLRNRNATDWKHIQVTTVTDRTELSAETTELVELLNQLLEGKSAPRKAATGKA